MRIKKLDPISVSKPSHHKRIDHSYVMDLFGCSKFGYYEQVNQKGIHTLKQVTESCRQPTTGIYPDELKKKFEHISLDHPLYDIDDALQELQELYLKDTTYYHHPDYISHLNCPIMNVSLLAEQIATAMNTAVETWDQSAGATFIEEKVIQWLIQQVGYKTKADGVFTTGGTQNNLMGLLLARDRQGLCEMGHQGNTFAGLSANAHKYRIFCSEHSHFSIQKSAALLGLGYQSVCPVACDQNLRMDPIALENEIKKADASGLIPIAVITTLGTTDYGTIDPIDSIADVCERYKCWLHVDGAYGGILLVMPSYRYHLRGIERADSVSVDFHKSFFQPVCCSAFAVKDKNMLSLLTYHADYLNPLSQKLQGTPDLINKSIQTTRRFDALKIWLSLRTVGAQALGHMFEQLIYTTKQVYQYMESIDVLEIVIEPVLSTIVFRFVHPKCNLEQLDHCNQSIRKHLARTGRAVIAGTKFQNKSYLKFTLLNPETKVASICDIVDEIVAYGYQEYCNVKNYQFT
tara:strand:+ start:6228 stop:7781 length:1554 start_codon:yes stop_codon:yes gene_type:complete